MSKYNDELDLIVDSLTQEQQSVFLYKKIAEHSVEVNQRQLFQQLAKEAEEQAKLWEVELIKKGGKLPICFKPSFRAKVVGQLIRWLGPRSLKTILAAMKIRGMSVYSRLELTHPIPNAANGNSEQHHHSTNNGNNLRAAIFGLNDGLISNLSLIMGMIGGAANNGIIIMAGVAGMLAGAFSMAAGEFISVKSQREMFEYQIQLEKKELELYPREEAMELELIYQARGLTKEEAEKVVAIMTKNPESALETLAREELGLDPDNLVSPYQAAVFSFMFFAMGACVPLSPFIFIHSNLIILFSIIATGLCLFFVGAGLSLYTGRSALKSGLRMLIIGGIAGGLTYFIGYCISKLIGG